jgi:hypothetical protein
MRPAARSALAAGLLALVAAPGAAEVMVDTGASIEVGSAQVDFGCNDLVVAGSFSAGNESVAGARDVAIEPSGVLNGDSATIEVAGDWANAGSFVAGTSTVELRDGCGLASAVIDGDTTFATLDLATATGKQYVFTAGSTQTISQTLALAGEAGNLLTLRSSAPGNAAFLDVQGSAGGDYVDVQDTQAVGTPVTVGSNSVIGTNSAGFAFGPAVPALSLAGGVALALAIAGAVRRFLAPRGRATG